MNHTLKKRDTNRVFYRLGSLLMMIALLYFGKPVLIPIALSVLLAFILAPLVHVLEGWRLGRLASVLLASGMAFAVIGLTFWAAAGQIRHLAADLPNHTSEIKAKVASLRMDSNSTLGRLTNMFKEIFPAEGVPETAAGIETSTSEFVLREPVLREPSAKDALVAPVPMVIAAPESHLASAADILLPVVEPLATAALVIVLVMFLLLRREDIRYRLISLMGHSALTGTTRLMRDTAERVSKYLFHLLVVNAGFGLWFGLGLYFLGVPYAPLWGFLTLCFRFIPFLGAPASVLFPLLISIATATGWSQPAWILIFFTVSELLTANVIEPVLFGKTTGLTPIALLVAALFWAWIWGPIGLLLSTPLTVCLVVLGQYLPHFRSLKVLLAEQPTLDARLQYFQRLLAQDVAEGQRVFLEYAAEFGRAQAFDNVIVQALTWTRRERLAGSISSKEEEFITTTTKQTILLPDKEMNDDANENQPPESNDSGEPFLVCGYPVHHEAEEISLMMLECLIDQECEIKRSTTRQLPSRVIAEITSAQPDVIVLLMMPPGGLPQVKYMCEELSQRCPDSSIIVTCLAKVKRYDELLFKLRKAGASYLTTSLLQTSQQILSLKAAKTPVAPAARSDKRVIGSVMASEWENDR